MTRHRNCTICGKPIILTPSAAERARKDMTGKPASYYLDLFTEHGDCIIAKRERDVRELIARRFSADTV